MRDHCSPLVLRAGPAAVRFFAAVHLALRMAALWLCASTAQAQITYTNSVDGTVNETVTPCTAPLLRTFNVPIHFTVADANIGVLMAHTYRGDLRFFLVHPNGTRITLGQNVGTTRDNVNVLFDDAAAAAYTTHTASNDTATAATVVPPYQRTFRPLVALSTFNGTNAFGTWTLEICDSLNADSGTFFQSDLILTASPATIVRSKTNTLISDPVNGATNPKMIPGALVRYCLTITNSGPGIAADIAITDALPAATTFVPGSMRSGATCATAATVEDDNATGADESDPLGASITGSTISIIQATMAPSSSFAVTFDVTIN